jgi:NAD(P)-dependent dehydrogenase (short-subunit alcohol dehydrogenase family)
MNFFVTGGSGGLGRQLVLDLVKAGHSVAFTFMNGSEAATAVVAEAAVLAPGSRCQAFRLDQRKSGQVEDVCGRLVDEWETIDVLVCNAAINRGELLISVSDDEWHDIIETNLTGPFLLSRALIPHFIGERRGRIIFISSVAMHGATGIACYAASKAGLIGLSGTIAREYGRRGVTSNVLSLGLLGEAGMGVREMSAQSFEHWRSLCPAGREGHLDEVSGLILYLASDGAAFVNGQTIGVTGGLDALT